MTGFGSGTKGMRVRVATPRLEVAAQVPATKQSTVNVSVTSPFLRMTILRCSSLMMRVRRLWPSRRLSHLARKRTGAATSAGGRGAEVEQALAGRTGELDELIGEGRIAGQQRADGMARPVRRVGAGRGAEGG